MISTHIDPLLFLLKIGHEKISRKKYLYNSLILLTLLATKRKRDMSLFKSKTDQLKEARRVSPKTTNPLTSWIDHAETQAPSAYNWSENQAANISIIAPASSGTMTTYNYTSGISQATTSVESELANLRGQIMHLQAELSIFKASMKPLLEREQSLQEARKEIYKDEETEATGLSYTAGYGVTSSGLTSSTRRRA